MNNKNKKVFAWFKISLIRIIFRPKDVHFYLNCNSLTFFILKILNFELIKIQYDKNFFNLKNENLFFEYDFLLHKYSIKILTFLKKNSIKFKKDSLIDKIYLSFISEDIKENYYFFIRSINNIKYKYPKSKINLIFNKNEFSNILSLLLKKKYKNIDIKISNNLLRS